MCSTHRNSTLIVKNNFHLEWVNFSLILEMNRAFPPRDGEKTWSAIPVDSVTQCGEETAASFLLSVRNEACTIPDVIYSVNCPQVPPAAPKPVPPRELTGWAANVLEAFSLLHAYVMDCDSFRDAGGSLPRRAVDSHDLVFGDKPPTKEMPDTAVRTKRRRPVIDVEDWPSSGDEALEGDIEEGDTSTSKNMDSGLVTVRPTSPPTAIPWLSSILAIDQREVRDILSSAARECGERRTLGMLQILWIYGLLSRLQRPLLASDASAVRQLFVFCTAFRKECSGGAEPEPGLVAALDALVLITGFFFGQRLSHE